MGGEPPREVLYAVYGLLAVVLITVLFVVAAYT